MTFEEFWKEAAKEVETQKKLLRGQELDLYTSIAANMRSGAEKAFACGQQSSRVVQNNETGGIVKLTDTEFARFFENNDPRAWTVL